jgi:WD40 repeat protein
MIRHHGPISGIAAFGGALVATAGYDNQVILWDAGEHRPLARAHHDHLANHVEFNADGTLLLTASSDYTARVWSLPDLKLRTVLSEHRDDVDMAAFHPSRPLVATVARDHLIRVHDLDTGTVVARLKGHTADILSVAWLADGTELVTSSDDGTVKRWSLETHAMTGDVDLGDAETDTIALSPTGVIYAGNDNGEIVTINGTRTTQHLAHEAGIKRLVHHAATQSLVSLSYDRTLRVWDCSGADGAPVLTHTTEFPAEVWPRSCAFLDDRTIVFGTFGTSYATYDLDSGTWDLTGVGRTRCLNAITAAADGVWTVGDAGVVWRDGREVATTGSLCNFLIAVGDRMLTGGQLGRLFDAADGETLHQHRSPLNCAAAFERDGVPHVVVGTYTGEGLVFAVGERVRHVATLPLHTNPVKDVAISGDTLFAVCADTSVCWFSLTGLRETGRVEKAHDQIANGCAALDEGAFASVGRDRTLRVWRGRAGHAIPTPHDHSIKCVAASDDGRFVASGSYAGTVAVRDLRTDTWSHLGRPTAAGISCLCYDAAKGRFLASSYDGSVHEVPVGGRIAA